MTKKRYLITGGAGFIGSNYVIRSVKNSIEVLNYDKLSYSGNLENLVEVQDKANYRFVKGDINDFDLLSKLLDEFKPTAIINFAAETHVDRSITDPGIFIKTNVLGTSNLLLCSLNYYKGLAKAEAEIFRFLQISTDEVFGSLKHDEAAFTELTAYKPNSPYSASKAGSDYLVHSFFKTYKFPTLISNCSNNYGPRQFPEKLIPLVILRALNNEDIPIYGNGTNIRDWLHVDDHCLAIDTILAKGRLGQSYNIGGNSERTNLEVVEKICEILEELAPSKNKAYKSLIKFVEDRAGHDFRYAINSTKIETELGWKAQHKFESALKETLNWYLNNQGWLKNIQSGEYRKWIEKNYQK